RALRDAIHTAYTVFGNELRNIRSDVTEVTKYAGSRRDDTAADLIIGLQTFFSRATLVGGYDAIIEVLNVDDVDANVFEEFPNRNIKFVHACSLVPLSVVLYVTVIPKYSSERR